MVTPERDQDAALLATQAAEDEVRLLGWLKSIGVPERSCSARLDLIKSVKAKEFLTWYLEEGEQSFLNGDGIYFFGPSFTGKSSAAAILVRERVRAKARARYYYAPDLQRALIRNEVLSDDVPVEEKCLKTDFLVVDDLGKEALSQHISPTLLSDLILRRVAAGRVCIITSTLGSDELQRRYGQDFISRIQAQFHKIQMADSWLESERDRRKLFEG